MSKESVCGLDNLGFLRSILYPFIEKHSLQDLRKNTEEARK